MNLADWLDAERGRSSVLAAHFRVTASSITQWRTKGVPVRRMCEVSALTGGAVSVEDLVRESAELSMRSISAAAPRKKVAQRPSAVMAPPVEIYP